MAAPPDSSHLKLPAKSSQTSAGENLATVSSSNGSPPSSVNNGNTVSSSNLASSVTGHLTDKGQAPTSSDQPTSTASANPVTSPNPSDTQPRGMRKDPQAPSENDKTEETSTAHTVTQKGPLPSRQKVNDSPNSEPAHARANGHGKSSDITKRKKPSFISKLVHILVPCISPGSHSVEVDTPASIPKESQTPKPEPEKVEVVLPEAPSKSSEPQSFTPKDPQDILDETGLVHTPVTPKEGTPNNADVIVPPTPTKTLPISETLGVTSGTVVPPGAVGPVNDKQNRASYVPSSVSTDGEESDSYTDDEVDDLADEDTDEELMNGGAGIPVGPDGVPRPLLPPIAPQHVGRKCLILDLDETLVHSSFKSFQQADYVVPVEIEYHWHNVYVIKRPGVDNFLKKMGEIYEVVVFTASLSKYADPVLDKLDVHRVVSHRLFRESCYNHKGNYVKDLSQLGRPIADTIILDNSPASYIFHPNNAVPVSSWFNDPHDTELTDLVPFLADLSTVDDVRGVLDGAR